MWLTIYNPKVILHLPQRFPQNTDTESHHFSSLGPILPVSLESQGSALGVTRVSFPKTFKTRNRNVSDNSVRYSCIYCQIPLIGISERARNFKTCFKIYFAMNCIDKINETFSLSAGTMTKTMNRHKDANEQWTVNFPFHGMGPTMKSASRHNDQCTVNSEYGPESTDGRMKCIKHWREKIL